jgi:hypothetical protein
MRGGRFCPSAALCAPTNIDYSYFGAPPALPTSIQNNLASSLFQTASIPLSAWVTGIFGSHGLTPFSTP